MKISEAYLKLILSFCLITTLELKASDLIDIPAGKIEASWLSPLKNQNQKSQVIIQISKFKLMNKAVTVSEYVSFLKNHSEWSKESISSIYADKSYLENLNVKNSNAPITQISWFAARAYCESLEMRLPTLNEWEYVAAASEKNKDANHDEKFLQRILEWYGEPQNDKLKSVGSIYKNLYHIYDMHGLIWEWVEDFNTTFVTGESREDSSFNKDMFCGAGSLSSTDKENYASFMRFAFRSSLKGKSTIWNLGFRCAK